MTLDLILVHSIWIEACSCMFAYTITGTNRIAGINATVAEPGNVQNQLETNCGKRKQGFCFIYANIA